MPVFELGEKSIRPVSSTTFSEAGLRERDDLQRLLRDEISVVADDVLVIAEEFGEWTESRRRIDLLGIDKDANIVVIELKRTEDGGFMELQAIRYASMLSTLTAAQAVAIFRSYLQNRESDDDAEETLLNFLGWDELNEDDFGQDVRIVLVSANFSTELTTAVLWLNEKDLDIRCVRLQPYRYQDRILVDVQQVIPLPEVADYQVKVREKKSKERAARKSNMDFTRYDIKLGNEVYAAQWKRNSILLVVKALYQHGISPKEIDATFRDFGRGNAFYSVNGEIEDENEYIELAKAVESERGKIFRPRRWHCRADDLMRSDGKTYILTNQWGRHWPSFMQGLRKKYPQIELDYWPVGEMPDE